MTKNSSPKYYGFPIGGVEKTLRNPSVKWPQHIDQLQWHVCQKFNGRCVAELQLLLGPNVNFSGDCGRVVATQSIKSPFMRSTSAHLAVFTSV